MNFQGLLCPGLDAQNENTRIDQQQEQGRHPIFSLHVLTVLLINADHHRQLIDSLRSSVQEAPPSEQSCVQIGKPPQPAETHVQTPVDMADVDQEQHFGESEWCDPISIYIFGSRSDMTCMKEYLNR